jgi:hypothetical protein
MGRWMQISVLGAVVVGGGGGSIAALLVSRAASGNPPAAPAVDPPRPPASPPVVTELPDPQRLLAAAMTTVLTRAAAWARDHAGEPCPELAELDVAAPDPWGHPLQLTCAAQPADQMIGAISAGPDGIAGNSDDVVSWQLGPEVTEPVRGPRWVQAKADARPKPSRHHRDGTSAAGSTGPVTHPPGFMSIAPTTPPVDAGAATAAPPPDAGGDDIPAHRSRR